MITLINSKKNTIVYETETYSVNDEKKIKLIVNKQNGKVVNYRFVTDKTPAPSITDKLEYGYYRKEIFKECSKKHFVDIVYDKYFIAFNKFKHQQIDLGRVLCLYGEGHMIFRLKDMSPVSTLLKFDYIGGITDRDYHIDDAFEYLKKHPFVKFIRMDDIPYYNLEKDKTRGLYLEVYIPEDEYKKIWMFCKNCKFPTNEVAAVLIDRCDKYKIDPLGIKKFLKMNT